MPDPDEGTVAKASRITGYWTEGIIKGLMIAGPTLLLLTASLGFTLMLVRRALTWDGKGGVS